MGEQVIVPFYLNEDIINEIYAIIIQKYVKVKSVTRRKQCIVNLTTPLSNIMQGECEYVDGNLSIQILNEYSRERIDERVSILIETFMNVLDILKEKGLLKEVNSKSDLNRLKNNDYVVVNSKIEKIPTLKNIEEMVNTMEAQQIFKKEKDVLEENIIKNLKDQLNEFKENECIKYLSQDIYNSNTKFVFPLRKKYMVADIEQLLNSNVFIFAKVTNFCNNCNDKEKILNLGGCFDYLEDVMIDAGYERNIPNSRKNIVRSISKNEIVETIPIALYI